jgi:hypothetical protein
MGRLALWVKMVLQEHHCPAIPSLPTRLNTAGPSGCLLTPLLPSQRRYPQIQGLKLLAALLPHQPPARAAAAAAALLPSILTRAAPEARAQLLPLLRDCWQRLPGAAAGAAAGAGAGSAVVDTPTRKRRREPSPGEGGAAAAAGGGSSAPGAKRREKRGGVGSEGDDRPAAAERPQSLPASQEREAEGKVEGPLLEGKEAAAAARAQGQVEEGLFVMLGDASADVARGAAEFWHGVLPRAPGARVAALLARAEAVGEGTGPGAGGHAGWRGQGENGATADTRKE